MAKIILSLILSLSLLFNICDVNAEESKEVQKDAFKQPRVDAHFAIAIDAKSNKVLFDQNGYTITPMASTTKILTALVALKYGDLDKVVEISSKSAAIRGSTVGYSKGEKITIRELLYGLMLRSGNDAAIAIAEGISGSVDEFLKLMNEYALEMGLVDSHFESPHGLDSANHYTTAYELAKITAVAKEVKEFNEIVSAKEITADKYNFTRSYNNINKILWRIPESTGVKTGYTSQAGKSLVTSVKHDGGEIIIVTINCPERWAETEKIDNYVKETYEYKTVVKKEDITGKFSVIDGKTEVEAKGVNDIVLPIKKGANVSYKIVGPVNAKAPISENQKFGMIEVYEDDKLVYIEHLYSQNNVAKKNFIQKIFNKN